MGAIGREMPFLDAIAKPLIIQSIAKPLNLTISAKPLTIHSIAKPLILSLKGGRLATRRPNNMQIIARTPLQLGNHVREQRRKLGLSQEQLAAKIGVRQMTVSNIEIAGRARLDTLLRLLAALDLELVLRPRTKSSAGDIEAIF